MRLLIRTVIVSAVFIAGCSAYAAASPDPGLRMLETENYSGAQAYFRSVLQKDPRNAGTAADMARLYLAQGQNKTGVQWARKAVALAPDNAVFEMLLGDAYVQYVNDVSFFSMLGIAHKTLAAYQKAVQLNPRDPNARFSLAMYYQVAPGIAGGSSSKAAQQIAALAKMAPAKADEVRAEDALAHKHVKRGEALLARAAQRGSESSAVTLALLLAKHGHQYARATHVLDQAIRKDPHADLAYYELGHVAVLGKTDVPQGIAGLQKYLGLPHSWRPGTPPYKWAHYRLGLLYGLDGDQSDEKVQYEAALKLDADFKQARKALASL
ncbi:MAG: tetratricopeptide repeat protein [Gammaproteobacteria bacterium]